MNHRVVVAVCVLAVVLGGVAVAKKKPAAAKHYEVSQKIKLGGEGGWDYLAMDEVNRRLYITRGSHVMVLDETGKPLADIPNVTGIHGVAISHSSGKGYISEGGSSKVAIFGLNDSKIIKEVEVGNTPDAIAYDPVSKRVFTFNARGHDSTALDEDGNKAGEIPLGGKPEFAVADGKGTVFVNIEDTSELAAIDTKTLTVKSRWPLAPCQEPSGLAMDQKNRRLFAGCDNKMMAIVDADSGKVVTTVPIGDGVDANAFDPGTGLAFASCGEGVLTVVQEESPDKYSVVDNVSTQRGARTMALDLKTHTVYLVTAEFGPAPEPTSENPRPRPTRVPGSFTLLIANPK